MKLQLSHPPVRYGDSFPLGKTGGLIEAPAWTGATSCSLPSFRWVKPAALIEALG